MNRQRLLVAWLGLGLLVIAFPGVSPAQGPQYLGKSLDAWAKELDSKDPVSRRSAAFALGKMGGRAGDYLAPLLKLLREDAVASVRQAAAHAVGEIGKRNFRATDNPDLLPTLQDALAKDVDPLVRRSAAVALGNLGSDAKKSQAALERALTDASPEVRQNAAWALGRTGVDSTRALKQAMTDPDPLMLREAARSLGLLGDKAHAALPELLACCRHADVEVRKAALQALVGLVGPDDKSAYEPLRHVLADQDREVRNNAALALGNVGGERAGAAVPVLLEALAQKDDRNLRRQAAAALGNIGPSAKAALEPLRQALRDSDPELRRNAAIGLGGLEKEAEPAYKDLLQLVAKENEPEQVRVQSAVALSKIGKAFVGAGQVALPEQAAPTLIAVVKDFTSPPEVRLRSLWALRPLNERLKNYPALFDALDDILGEEKTRDNRMLRYDAAFLLGVFKRGDVSDKVLDVLNEFLCDDTVQRYKGVDPKVRPLKENRLKPGAPVEKGQGDGRVMAVVALRYIGPERLRTRKDIIMQLRALQNTPDPAMRKEIRAVLDKLDD
jgi:HEAT repeat protein